MRDRGTVRERKVNAFVSLSSELKGRHNHKLRDAGTVTHREERDFVQSNSFTKVRQLFYKMKRKECDSEDREQI
jgi:hypothetical protein